MNYDWIVVGAGFTGATFSQQMAAAGKRVLLVERRSHLGGNAYDEKNEHGILVHRYGPHIFHTNSDVVWRYLSNFTKWRPYEHRVLGLIEGKLVPIPFNLDSLAALFPAKLAAEVESALIGEYGSEKRVPILKLRESDKPLVREFADYVYKNVFEGYTVKQWELRPEELSAGVTARVPVSISHDDRYFQDIHQAMPLDGYAALFGRMLDHPNIDKAFDCDWKSSVLNSGDTQVLYTGAVDELMGYRFGPLPYRSIEFREETLEKRRHQPVGTINYPNDFDYTRITEQKNYAGEIGGQCNNLDRYETSTTTHQENRISCYPVSRDERPLLANKYAAAAQAEFTQVHFAGRLADYQYYNGLTPLARLVEPLEYGRYRL